MTARGVESAEREWEKKRQCRGPVSRTGGDYGLIKRARPDRPLPCPAESDANKQRRLHLAADNAADVVPFLFIYFIFLAEHTLHVEVGAGLSDADSAGAGSSTFFLYPPIVSLNVETSPLSAALNSAMNFDLKLVPSPRPPTPHTLLCWPFLNSSPASARFYCEHPRWFSPPRFLPVRWRYSHSMLGFLFCFRWPIK